MVSFISGSPTSEVKSYWMGKGLSPEVSERIARGTATASDISRAELIQEQDKEIARGKIINKTLIEQQEKEYDDLMGVFLMGLLILMILVVVIVIIYGWFHGERI